MVVVYLALQIRQTQQFMRAQVERPIMRISVDGGERDQLDVRRRDFDEF